MKNGFTMSTVVPATPEQVFKAWLSTAGHAAMTGSPARVEPRVGGSFTAWDGYILGRTLEVKPYSRILQAWRTTEFPEGNPDSRLEILLEQDKAGTKITLNHTEIPEGQADDYKKGWEDFYFKPMLEYFNKKTGGS